jgi:hypothetical protein
MRRYRMTPEKIEMGEGKLFISEADRLLMLGMLLENCGLDAAVRMGDPEEWRRAVARLDDPQTNLRSRVHAMLRQWDSLGVRDEAQRFYVKWAAEDYTETRDGKSLSAGQAADLYPVARDWVEGAWFQSSLIEIAVESGQSRAVAIRKGTTHRRGAVREGQQGIPIFTSYHREEWTLLWRDEGLWRLTAARMTQKTELS